MRNPSNTLVVGVCAAALAGLQGLAAQAPPQKPAAKQPSTLAEARKALEGKWTLVSLTVHGADGRSAAIDAGGTLTSDFSSLAIMFTITPAGLKTLEGLGIRSPNPKISLSGRVIIDTQKQHVTFASDDIDRKMLGFDADLAARRANPFALERVRTYVFNEDGTMRLATQHDNGKDASVSVWRKSS